MTREAIPEVATNEHWLERGGVGLYVWEKCAGMPGGKQVVVLAHGSATAGRESFDLDVPGKPSYSLMTFLAREGFDVFAPDVRGFGRSTRPPGHMATADAAADLATVVHHVLKLRGVEKVHLLGWSWGTQYAGMFVMAHPEKTARYVSYAQMHAASPDLVRRRSQIETYKTSPYLCVPQAAWRDRFFSMTPAEANDPEVVDSYAEAAARVEVRTPTGPQLDMVTIMPMVNPRLVSVPTMMIHGEHDDVADVEGLSPFFQQLPNPDKRFVVIPGAGHMMHLQKGHRLFQAEVASFFKEP